jgi:dCTP diphosphatase
MASSGIYSAISGNTFGSRKLKIRLFLIFIRNSVCPSMSAHSAESKMSSERDDGSAVRQTNFGDLKLEDVRKMMHEFSDERDWHQYHTPRNLMLALTGEVGELAEVFQWKGEVEPYLPEFTDDEKRHLGEELADVQLYLVRLADRCGVDLSAAVTDKMQKNRAKYPADKVKGSSKKYNEYHHTKITHATANKQ